MAKIHDRGDGNDEAPASAEAGRHRRRDRLDWQVPARNCIAVAALAASIALASPAVAAPAAAKWGDPIKAGDGLTIDPIVEGRVRYERVEQDSLPIKTGADPITLRLRAGAEFKMDRLSLLVEGEGTLALADGYNAFPFTIADGQRRPQYATVPDPMNVELNRLQMQYKGSAATVTLGRQRINLDDQRWVGSVGWRQNEQTFDAVRGEAKFGPISFDGTYAINQRTIFGVDAGPRRSYDGQYWFLGAGAKLGPVNLKGFAYLLDYDEPFFLANSSQSYGARAGAAIPLSPKAKLNLMASYAHQSDYGGNPADYSAEYMAAEAGVAFKALILTAGWERLGADGDAANGAGRAVQTPMATLHKFNGWADLFLTTPNTGLQDLYAGAAYRFDGIKALPGLNAAVTWHQFDSDIRGIDYGSEWDASVGFKLGRFALLAKYANYDARRLGVDTEKLWLQAEVSY